MHTMHKERDGGGDLSTWRWFWKWDFDTPLWTMSFVKVSSNVPFLLVYIWIWKFKCKNENVYPKFVQWKSVKDKPFGIRRQLYQKNFQNAIKDKYCCIKELKIELNKALLEFENSTTRIKWILIKFSINHLISNKLREGTIKSL